MPKPIDLDKLAASNPIIDPGQARSVLELIDELKRLGFLRLPGYRLRSPFQGPKVVPVRRRRRIDRPPHAF